MKRITILLFSILCTYTLVAQTEYDNETPPENSEEEFVGFNKKNKTKKDLSRIRIGGTAGFGIANGQIGVSFSPTVGYQVVEDRIELGGGFQYDFFSERVPSINYKYTQHTYGPTAYARVYIWEGLFAQVRAVYLFADGKETFPSGIATITNKYSASFFNVFGGAGYSIPMGEKAFFNVGLEINLIPYNTNGSNSSRRERVPAPFLNFQFSL